jgi:hypothetical protein
LIQWGKSSQRTERHFSDFSARFQVAPSFLSVLIGSVGALQLKLSNKVFVLLRARTLKVLWTPDSQLLAPGGAIMRRAGD